MSKSKTLEEIAEIRRQKLLELYYMCTNEQRALFDRTYGDPEVITHGDPAKAEWAIEVLEKIVDKNIETGIDGITAKAGLLWWNGRILSTFEADNAARKYGYQFAETMVKALGGKRVEGVAYGDEKDDVRNGFNMIVMGLRSQKFTKLQLKAIIIMCEGVKTVTENILKRGPTIDQESKIVVKDPSFGVGHAK